MPPHREDVSWIHGRLLPLCHFSLFLLTGQQKSLCVGVQHQKRPAEWHVQSSGVHALTLWPIFSTQAGISQCYASARSIGYVQEVDSLPKREVSVWVPTSTKLPRVGDDYRLK